MNFQQIRASIDAWYEDVDFWRSTLVYNYDAAHLSKKISRSIEVGELSAETLERIEIYLIELYEKYLDEDDDYDIEHRSGYIPDIGEFGLDLAVSMHAFVDFDRSLEYGSACTYSDGVLRLEMGFKIAHTCNGDSIESYVYLDYSEMLVPDMFDDYYVEPSEDSDEDLENDFDDPYLSDEEYPGDLPLPNMVHIGDGVWCDSDGDNWDFF